PATQSSAADIVGADNTTPAHAKPSAATADTIAPTDLIIGSPRHLSTAKKAPNGVPGRPSSKIFDGDWGHNATQIRHSIWILEIPGRNLARDAVQGTPRPFGASPRETLVAGLRIHPPPPEPPCPGVSSGQIQGATPCTTSSSAAAPSSTAPARR